MRRTRRNISLSSSPNTQSLQPVMDTCDPHMYRVLETPELDVAHTWLSGEMGHRHTYRMVGGRVKHPGSLCDLKLDNDPWSQHPVKGVPGPPAWFPQCPQPLPLQLAQALFQICFFPLHLRDASIHCLSRVPCSHSSTPSWTQVNAPRIIASEQTLG